MQEHKGAWDDERIQLQARIAGRAGERDDDDKKLLLVLTEANKKVGKLELHLARHLQAGALPVCVHVSEPLARNLADEQDSAAAKKRDDKKDPRLQLTLRISLHTDGPAASPAPAPAPASSPAHARRASSAETPTPPPLRRAATDISLRRSDSAAEVKKDKKEKKEREAAAAADDKDKEAKDKSDKKEKKESAHRRSHSRQQLDAPPLAASTSPAPAGALLSPEKARGHRRGASLSIASMVTSDAASAEGSGAGALSPGAKDKAGFRQLRMSHDVAAALASQEKEIEALRQQLEVRQQMEADEKFLIENALYFCEPVYSHEVPVSAYVLFRALLQWRAFHDGSTLPQTVGDAFDKVVQKHAHVRAAPQLQVYWLASACMLLHLLKKQLHVSGGEAELGGLRAFETRLLGFVGTLFQALVRGCQAQLDPLLVPAVLEQPDLMQQQAASVSSPRPPGVDALVAVLQTYATHVTEGCVFRSVGAQLFRQLFHYMNARLLNALLEKRAYCRCANGIQIKMAVSQLLEWAARSPLAEAAREQLEGIRQAADVLVVAKASLLDANVRRELCPALNNAQLAQLLAMYNPDEFDPDPLDAAVLRTIQALDRSLGSALLDANYCFPLVSSDWAARRDLDFGRVQIPPVLLSRPGFAFLQNPTQASSAAGGAW